MSKKFPDVFDGIDETLAVYTLARGLTLRYMTEDAALKMTIVPVEQDVSKQVPSGPTGFSNRPMVLALELASNVLSI